MKRFGSSGVVMILLLAIITMAKGDPDTTIYSIECSIAKVGEDDSYTRVVKQLLYDLASKCPAQEYHEGYMLSTDGKSVAYGYSDCNVQLSVQDCTTCGAKARDALLGECSCAVAANVVMGDCRMVYDDWDFYGGYGYSY